MRKFLLVAVLLLTACDYESSAVVVTQYNECKRLYELAQTQADSLIIDRVRMSRVEEVISRFGKVPTIYVAHTDCKRLVLGN